MQEPAAGSEAQAHGQYLNLPASTAAFDAAPLIPHTIDVLRKVRDNLEDATADMVADVSQVARDLSYLVIETGCCLAPVARADLVTLLVELAAAPQCLPIMLCTSLASLAARLLMPKLRIDRYSGTRFFPLGFSLPWRPLWRCCVTLRGHFGGTRLICSKGDIARHKAAVLLLVRLGRCHFESNSFEEILKVAEGIRTSENAGGGELAQLGFLANFLPVEVTPSSVDPAMLRAWHRAWLETSPLDKYFSPTYFDLLRRVAKAHASAARDRAYSSTTSSSSESGQDDATEGLRDAWSEILPTIADRLEACCGTLHSVDAEAARAVSVINSSVRSASIPASATFYCLYCGSSRGVPKGAKLLGHLLDLFDCFDEGEHSSTSDKANPAALSILSIMSRFTPLFHPSSSRSHFHELASFLKAVSGSVLPSLTAFAEQGSRDRLRDLVRKISSTALPLALRLTFNDKMHVKMMGHSAVQTLAQVNPTTASNLLCERLEEDLHLSMEASRRAPALLTSLSLALRPLIVTKSTDGENEVLFPLLQELMHLSLPGLDPNDLYKTIATASCFVTLFSWVRLQDEEDINNVAESRTSEAQLESRFCEESVGMLARLRSSFEGFASLFIDRILVLVAAMDSHPASKPSMFESMRDRGLMCAIDAFAQSLSPKLLHSSLQQILPSVLSCPSTPGDNNAKENNLTEGSQLFLTLLEAIVRADPVGSMDFLAPRLRLRFETIGCDLDNGSSVSSFDLDSFCWLLHILGALANSALTASCNRSSSTVGSNSAPPLQEPERMLVKYRFLFEGALLCAHHSSGASIRNSSVQMTEAPDEDETEKETSIRTAALNMYENLLASLLGTYPAKLGQNVGHKSNWGKRMKRGEFSIDWHIPIASEKDFAESLLCVHFDSSVARLTKLAGEVKSSASSVNPKTGTTQSQLPFSPQRSWKQALDILCSSLHGMIRAGLLLSTGRVGKILLFCRTVHPLLLRSPHPVDVAIVKRFVKLVKLFMLCIDQRQGDNSKNMRHVQSILWHRQSLFNDEFAKCRARLFLQQEASSDQESVDAWRQLELIQPPWIAEKEALFLHMKRNSRQQQLFHRISAATKDCPSDPDDGHGPALATLIRYLVDLSCHAFASVRLVAQSSVNTILSTFPELIEQMLPELISAAEDNDVSTNEHDLFGRAIGLVSLLHQRQCIIGAWRLKSGTNCDYSVRLVRALTTGPLLNMIKSDDERSKLDTLCSSLLVALIRGRGHMIPNSVRCEAHHSIYMNCAHEAEMHWRVRLVLWAFELAVVQPSDYLDQPDQAKRLLDICMGCTNSQVPALPLRRLGIKGLISLAMSSPEGSVYKFVGTVRIDTDAAARAFFENLMLNHATTLNKRSQWSAGVAELLEEIWSFHYGANDPHSSTTKLDNTVLRMENVLLVRCLRLGQSDNNCESYSLVDLIRCLEEYTCGLSDEENLRAKRCVGAECLCGIVLERLHEDHEGEKDTVSEMWRNHLEKLFVRYVGEASPLGKADWIHTVRILVRGAISNSFFCRQILAMIQRELIAHAKSHSAKQLHTWLSILCAAVDELSTCASETLVGRLSSAASEILLDVLRGPCFEVVESACQHSISLCRQASAGCLFVFHRALRLLTSAKEGSVAREILEHLHGIALRISDVNSSSLLELESGLQWCLLEQYSEAGAIRRPNPANLADHRIADNFLGMALKIQNVKQGGKMSELAQIANRVVQVARGASVMHLKDRSTFWQALEAASTSDAVSTRCAALNVASTIYARSRHSLTHEMLAALEKIVLSGLADKKSVEVQEKSAHQLNVIILSSDGFEAARRLLPQFLAQLRTKIPKARATIMPESFVAECDSNASHEVCKTLWEAKVAKRVKTRANRLAKLRQGQLGISACVSAFPYTIPDWVPDALVELALSRSRGGTMSLQKLFATFRQTHQDGWDRHHKWKFTPEQMDVLRDAFLPSNYYA